VHDALKLQKLGAIHVVHPAFEVPRGRDQTVAEQRRRTCEKGDRAVVAIDEVVPIIGVTRHGRADETRPVADTSFVLLEVERRLREAAVHIDATPTGS
jgi:hypothetical protein